MIQWPIPTEPLKFQTTTTKNPYVGVTTCGELQGMVDVTTGFAMHSAECSLFRLLAVYCGCPRPANACPLCPLQPMERQQQQEEDADPADADDATTI